MNSLVPGEPRSALEASAEHGEAARQLPVLERSGEVDGTGLALQEGQVVDGSKVVLLFAPVTGVAGDDVGAAGDGHVFDPAEDGHLVMGIGGRHRVVVAVETHEGERVGVALATTRRGSKASAGRANMAARSSTRRSALVPTLPRTRRNRSA